MLYTSMLSAQFLVIFVQIIYNLVDRVGIEPTSTGSGPVTLPLNYLSISGRKSGTRTRIHGLQSRKPTIDRTLDVWYPRWNSNPHCADFKSAASTSWATRACDWYSSPDSDRDCVRFELTASTDWARRAFT